MKRGNFGIQNFMILLRSLPNVRGGERRKEKQERKSVAETTSMFWAFSPFFIGKGRSSKV